MNTKQEKLARIINHLAFVLEHAKAEEIETVYEQVFHSPWLRDNLVEMLADYKSQIVFCEKHQSYEKKLINNFLTCEACFSEALDLNLSDMDKYGTDTNSMRLS